MKKQQIHTLAIVGLLCLGLLAVTTGTRSDLWSDVENDARIIGFIGDEISEEGIANATVTYMRTDGYGQWGTEPVDLPDPGFGERYDDDIGYPYDGDMDQWWIGYYFLTTDENGFYDVDIISGVYYVSVSAMDHYGWSGQIVVGEGDVLHLNTLLKPLPPRDSVITGTVRCMETGLPMEDVNLEFWEVPRWSPWDGGSYYHEMWENTVTDPDGTYSLEVRKGTYSVYVWVQGYLPFFTNVNVPPNTTVILDISLEEIYIPPKDASVRGTITGPYGEVVQGAYISLEILYHGYRDHNYEVMPYPEYDMSYGWHYGYYDTNSNSDGTYHIQCPSGMYSMNVWAIGYMPVRMIVEPKANVPLDVNITLAGYPEPNSNINGVVRDRLSGDPIADVSIYVYSDFSYPYPPSVGDEPSFEPGQAGAIVYSDEDMAYRETVYHNDPWFDHGMFFGETTTDSEGRYTIDIPGGTFILSTWAEGYSQSLTRFNIGEYESVSKDILLMPGGEDDAPEYGWILPVDGSYINDSPVLIMDHPITIDRQGWTILDLEDYFHDPDGDVLSFSFSAPEGFQGYIDSNNRLHLKAPEDYSGGDEVVIHVSDGQTTLSGTLQMELSDGEQVPFVIFGLSILGAMVVLGVLLISRKRGMDPKNGDIPGRVESVHGSNHKEKDGDGKQD